MKNNITNIFLGTILVAIIIVIGCILGSTKDVVVNCEDEPTQTILGYGGYNELGYSGMTHDTVDVGIEGGGTTSSTTAYKILSSNSGRMYAEIELDAMTSNEIRLWFGTTTFSSGATTTYASSTKYWVDGKKLSTSTSDIIYKITPDNLWKGEVWGIATTSTTTVRILEK